MNNLDALLKGYIDRFLDGNRVAGEMAQSLEEAGVGLMPLLDHCTIRTRDVDRRARQFLDLGYGYDDGIGVLEFNTWWAKVFRKPGHPTLFIDQAYAGERGRDSLIPQWVEAHGDECFHHIAILVENIDHASGQLQDKGYDMAGAVVGGPGSDLRQVFTKPEIRNGEVYTVLELIERHNGYAGFLPPQADGLMESTRN
ncbi:MAG: VOC family protein [Nitrospinaceae bacterium]